MSDVVIITGIIILFVSVGALLPMVRADFGLADDTNYSTSSMVNKMADAQNHPLTGIWIAIMSIFSMFFWTFGAIHWLLDLVVFVPLRLALGFLVIRNLIGSGA
jgi:divalent metal cation (Fe/Co/Zn/Cd) transporter